MFRNLLAGRQYEADEFELLRFNKRCRSRLMKASRKWPHIDDVHWLRVGDGHNFVLLNVIWNFHRQFFVLPTILKSIAMSQRAFTARMFLNARLSWFSVKWNFHFVALAGKKGCLLV
jgi:hypothetical protein